MSESENITINAEKSAVVPIDQKQIDQLTQKAQSFIARKNNPLYSLKDREAIHDKWTAITSKLNFILENIHRPRNWTPLKKSEAVLTPESLKIARFFESDFYHPATSNRQEIFIKNLVAMQNSTSFKNLNAILDLKLLTPKDLVLDQLFYDDCFPQVVQRVEDIVHLPQFRELQTNPSLVHFIKDACVLFNVSFNVSDFQHLELFKKLWKNKSSLAIFEAVRELKIQTGEWHLSSALYPLSSIIENQQQINTLLKPEFKKFISHIHKDLYCEVDIVDLESYLQLAQNHSLVKAICSFDNQLQKLKGFYINRATFRLLAEKPEEALLRLKQVAESLSQLAQSNAVFRDKMVQQVILDNLVLRPEVAKDRVGRVVGCLTKYPDFFNNLKRKGLFYSTRAKILSQVFQEDDPERMIAYADRLSAQKMPYWKFLFAWTDQILLQKELKNCVSSYPITAVNDIPLQKISRHILEQLISSSFIPQIEKGTLQSMPFNQFTYTGKRLALRDHIRKTVEMSRDLEKKQKADDRNRRSVSEELTFKDDDYYIHGASIKNIESVLLNGNLCGECLGEKSSADSFPFHVDFTSIVASSNAQKIKDTFLHSLSSNYGNEGLLSGQIFYVYKRDSSSYEAGKQVKAKKQTHTLILGGIPSTEITGIVLRNSFKTLGQAKRSVMKNGFYIPIYNLEGTLLFTQEEYDKVREDLKLSIPVEIWDYSMETGTQLGSNPGAEVSVPGKGKESHKKYYVKFEYPESPGQIWVEKLAEDMYRTLNIPVPETQIVQLTRLGEQIYGHASLLIEGDHKQAREIKKMQSWSDGFIADALMANWDIPYAPERNAFVGRDGKVYRLDNGGVLIYRARGQKKGIDSFGPIVNEIQFGQDKERLGYGMRQEYPTLTDDDIKKQVANLKEKLTDDVLDSLVDNVRIPKNDRDFLKDILKKRRDYIINHT